jgi:hypothetical protein
MISLRAVVRGQWRLSNVARSSLALRRHRRYNVGAVTAVHAQLADSLRAANRNVAPRAHFEQLVADAVAARSTDSQIYQSTEASPYAGFAAWE